MLAMKMTMKGDMMAHTNSVSGFKKQLHKSQMT